MKLPGAHYFFLLLLLLVIVHAATEKPGPQVFPRGTASLSNRVAFTAGPQGGIDAIDLTTGVTVWHSGIEGQPLALFKNETLLAVSNLRNSSISILRSDNGSLVGHSDRLPVESPADFFSRASVRTDCQAQCRLMIKGPVHAPYRGGAATNFESEYYRKLIEFKVDISTGRVLQLVYSQEIRETDSSEGYYQKGVLHHQRWPFENGSFATLVRGTQSGKPCIFLKIWRPEPENGNSTPLSCGTISELAVSNDGRFVLAVMNEPESSEIFDLRDLSHASGLALGKRVYEFVIMNQTLYYVAPVTTTVPRQFSLRAFDLVSHQSKWQRDIKINEAQAFELRP